MGVLDTDFVSEHFEFKNLFNRDIFEELLYTNHQINYTNENVFLQKLQQKYSLGAFNH